MALSIFHYEISLGGIYKAVIVLFEIKQEDRDFPFMNGAGSQQTHLSCENWYHRKCADSPGLTVSHQVNVVPQQGSHAFVYISEVG